MSNFEPQTTDSAPAWSSRSPPDAQRRDTLRALLSDVDELLGYIAIVKTPEVDAVRPTLERALRAARRELLRVAKLDSSVVRQPALNTARWLPSLAIAVAASVGLVVAWWFRHKTR